MSIVTYKGLSAWKWKHKNSTTCIVFVAAGAAHAVINEYDYKITTEFNAIILELLLLKGADCVVPKRVVYRLCDLIL